MRVQLHLATADGLWPHVSLMNYTYLPSSPYANGPVIVMTMPPSTKKTCNLVSNPRVSLLVHDWVSHRASISSNPSAAEESPAAIQQPQHTSSLASLLANLNTAALSSISATLFGYAEVVEAATEQEHYYKEVHAQNNPEGGDRCWQEGADVKVVVVRIGWCRVADYRGDVRDWVAEGEEEARAEFETGGGSSSARVGGTAVVNGV